MITSRGESIPTQIKINMTNSTKSALSAVVETITPAIAEAYLQHNHANRHPNMALIKYYADQMKKGNWLLNGEAICFDENGDLTNGQHRLMAVIMAGVSIQTLVVRNTPEGSFATYDQGKKRTPGDVFSLCDILNATRTSAIVRRYYFLREGYSIAGNAIGAPTHGGHSPQPKWWTYITSAPTSSKSSEHTRSAS